MNVPASSSEHSGEKDREMDHSPPIVSIVIPAWNASKTIERCLASIGREVYPNKEVVLIDDGSEDDTVKRAEALLADAPYAWKILSKSHAGACAARNMGIRESRGTFVQFLDADDEMSNNKLLRSMELFSTHPDLVGVYTDATKFLDGITVGVISADHQDVAALADRSSSRFTCALNTNFPIWRREFLIRHELWWDESLVCWQEAEYYLRVLLASGGAHRVRHLAESCIRFHRESKPAGISGSYWSTRYILGQYAACRKMAATGLAAGLDPVGIEAQYLRFMRLLMIRSVVGGSREAWTGIQHTIVAAESSWFRKLAWSLPFAMMRFGYVMYRGCKGILRGKRP